MTHVRNTGIISLGLVSRSTTPPLSRIYSFKIQIYSKQLKFLMCIMFGVVIYESVISYGWDMISRGSFYPQYEVCIHYFGH